MGNIKTSFRIAHKEGAELGYYGDKNELYKDITGIQNSTFDCEILEVDSVFFHKDKKLKIVDISIELHGKSDEEEQKDLDFDSKTFVVVVIFIEYID